MELKLKIPKQIQQNYSILNYDYAAPFDIFLEEYIDGLSLLISKPSKFFTKTNFIKNMPSKILKNLVVKQPSMGDIFMASNNKMKSF